VARAACFHANKAWLKFAEKQPSQRFTDKNLPNSINRMYLKNVLQQIQANRIDIHSGWFVLLVFVLTTTILAHRNAASGSYPHHLLRGSERKF
tara:strand:+ start:237 stop:515 length:279 start_codon:yes stop_codon:yes gene_type:complete